MFQLGVESFKKFPYLPYIEMWSDLRVMCTYAIMYNHSVHTFSTRDFWSTFSQWCQLLRFSAWTTIYSLIVIFINSGCLGTAEVYILWQAICISYYWCILNIKSCNCSPTVFPTTFHVFVSFTSVLNNDIYVTQNNSDNIIKF